MQEPLLSVCLITYNHVKYIKQAIDSVLMQKVNFSWELIIADDCSTDGTREILLEYRDKHPGFIKLILQEKNVGPARNWMDLITFPGSKYISYFEGDDYWTDMFKLQKQVDFLESNPDYAICFHGVYELEEGNSRLIKVKRSDEPEAYTIEDLAKVNFIHTISIVYRHNLIRKFPEWIFDSPVGDYVLHMLNSQFGKIKYLPDLMAVYRKHSRGAWSQQHFRTTWNKWIKVLDYLLIENFSKEVKNNLRIQRKETIVALLNDLYFHDEKLFKEELQRFVNNDPEFAKEWLLVYYPALIKSILNSRTYRIGNAIVKPIKKIKSFLRK